MPTPFYYYRSGLFQYLKQFTPILEVIHSNTWSGSLQGLE